VSRERPATTQSMRTARSASELEVTEIFHSIQGESTRAGTPCTFVRLTGCGLRCTYCDTQYAFSGGRKMSPGEVVAAVEAYPARLVEITGGEPLEQPEAIELMGLLLDAGFEVMLETGGHVPIDRVPPQVIKIIDVKCPDSGEGGTFQIGNIEMAQPHDEFKFVLASETDYAWARDFYRTHLETRPHTVLFSPVHGELDLPDLARWILDDGLRVRLQIQIHKHIWGPDARGV
jgi:7-carboxy-7-deazaguanine synthase